MKAFINSIIFASLAACTVAPAQAGVWDWMKTKASAVKNGITEWNNNHFPFHKKHPKIYYTSESVAGGCVASIAALCTTIFYYVFKEENPTTMAKKGVEIFCIAAPATATLACLYQAVKSARMAINPSYRNAQEEKEEKVKDRLAQFRRYENLATTPQRAMTLTVEAIESM